ncbi:hypothetical protein CFOL_v3_04524 [Cephalotus follicularis]|uniref:LysM domain-containing protein n=1 Tax=Cephalotus follicularis TaxID=3775 RepID=A0A1Q3AZ05_CEPFO|nr:hypothetical protein CFOL_v3_04524 [Cephalotus follicularis]
MQMKREKDNIGNHNHNYNYNNYGYSSSIFCNNSNTNYYYNNNNEVVVDRAMMTTTMKHKDRDRDRDVKMTSSSASSSGVAVGFIQHPVSKFDTLAGVAIKYGVEVADIKKMNGLVTDLQMFALKSLQIPLPGRHPPSPCLLISPDNVGRSCHYQSPPRNAHCDLLDSFHSLRLKSSQRKVSPAMSSLQGYYGLKPNDQRNTSEGLEMAVYRKGCARYLEDGPFVDTSPTSNPPLSRHRKSRSVTNGFVDENGDPAANLLTEEAREGDSEKLLRRRQKSAADFTSCTPEMLLKKDNSNGSGFSAITGKGLALRNKAVSRIAFAADSEEGGLNPIPIGLGDSHVVDGSSAVRKSSSTSSLQDQEASGSSLRQSSKRSLKPDLQVLSSAAVTRPIFDGLPKPLTGWRNKAAMD